MKRILAVFIILCLASTPVFADFKEKEYPLSGLNIDTAYTLHEHEFLIKESFPDLTLPISFGIFDGLQISTRGVLWFTKPGLPNGALKCNIFPETNDIPAVSVGFSAAGSALNNFTARNSDGTSSITMDKIELFYWNFTVYMSKKLADVYISGSVTYNKLSVTLHDSAYDTQTLNDSLNTTLKYYTGKDDPLAMSNTALVLAWQWLPWLRLVAEGLVLIEEPFAYYTALGAVLAIGDNMRLEAGIGRVKVISYDQGLPHLSASLRF